MPIRVFQQVIAFTPNGSEFVSEKSRAARISKLLNLHNHSIVDAEMSDGRGSTGTA
jgi:hypothetical protein